MLRTFSLMAAGAIAACSGGALASAQEASLTDSSLVGTWVVNLGKCTDPKAEFLVFNKNGSVESVREGHADAAGFWRLENDRIFLNVLAPPARLDERLKDIEGYYPFDITIATFDVTTDSFQGVAILGDQTRYGKLTRCRT
jgi:hypothetical protein